MIPVIEKLQYLIVKLFMGIVYISATIIPASLFIQVIFRYFLHNPLQGIEEIAVLSFKCLVIFGSAVLFKENQHIVVDMFVQKLTERARNIVSLLNNLLMAAIIVLVIQSSINALPFQKFYKSVIFGIPKSLYTIMLIISLSFMLLSIIFSLLKLADTGFSGARKNS